MTVNRIKLFNPLREPPPAAERPRFPAGAPSRGGTKRKSFTAWADEHPGVYLGAAILLGATLAWFIKRR